MSDVLEFQDRSPAYDKFNHDFDAIYDALQDPTKKSEHAQLHTALVAMVLAFVRHDLNVNAAVESNHFMNKTPIWFASMCLAEEIKFGASTLKARTQAVSPLWKVLAPLPLSFQFPGNHSLTVRALHGGYYATATLIWRRDTQIKESIAPPLNNAIPRRSAKKLTVMAIEFMDQLHEADKNVNRASTMNGVTPMMVASALTNIECMTWLIERGADVNARDTRSGATPIMHALDSKFGIGDFSDRKHIAQALKLLIDHGADLHAVSSTQEDFGRLVLNCKALKGEDRAFYKHFWKTYKAQPAKEPGAVKKQELERTYLCEGVVSPADIQELHRSTDLLYLPYPALYHHLIRLLESRGVLKLTHHDIARLADPAWNGVVLGDLRRDFSPKSVEKQLNKFAVGGIKRGLNLHRDESGVFHILSDSRKPRVIAVR
jgi:Ankyrin repeats (3 copies)